MELIKDRQLRHSLFTLGLVELNGSTTIKGRTLFLEIQDINHKINSLAEALGYHFRFKWEEEPEKRKNPWLACKTDNKTHRKTLLRVRSTSKTKTKNNHA